MIKIDPGQLCNNECNINMKNDIKLVLIRTPTDNPGSIKYPDITITIRRIDLQFDVKYIDTHLNREELFIISDINALVRYIELVVLMANADMDIVERVDHIQFSIPSFPDIFVSNNCRIDHIDDTIINALHMYSITQFATWNDPHILYSC